MLLCYAEGNIAEMGVGADRAAIERPGSCRGVQGRHGPADPTPTSFDPRPAHLPKQEGGSPRRGRPRGALEDDSNNSLILLHVSHSRYGHDIYFSFDGGEDATEVIVMLQIRDGYKNGRKKCGTSARSYTNSGIHIFAGPSLLAHRRSKTARF